MKAVRAKLQRFNRDNGWYFITVPVSISKTYQRHADRGLIAISAKVGSEDWRTSMLPYGDGTHFIPIPQRIRMKNNYKIGDTVEVKYELR